MPKTFVLVHGAFHGGWCWRRVADLLEAQGHKVFTPTLTGLGERSHLTGPQVNLSTHITDVVNVFKWEQLSDAVLCGHSYAGMVIAGVAERVASSAHDDRDERASHLLRCSSRGPGAHRATPIGSSTPSGTAVPRASVADQAGERARSASGPQTVTCPSLRPGRASLP